MTQPTETTNKLWINTLTQISNGTVFKKWKVFFAILFDPVNLILIGLIVALFYVSKDQTNRDIITTLTITLSIFTGVLGGRVAKTIDEYTEEKVVEARGKSAVRGLKLLLRSTHSLENRVQIYLKRFRDDMRHDQIGSEVVETYLEEVIERCNIIEEEVISSIENWTDIIPEADIQTEIGLLTDLKNDLQKETIARRALQDELQATQDQSEENIKLKNQIVESEMKMVDLYTKITRQSSTFPSSGSSAIRIPYLEELPQWLVDLEQEGGKYTVTNDEVPPNWLTKDDDNNGVCMCISCGQAIQNPVQPICPECKMPWKE